MNKIEAFQAEDGTLFAKERDAKRHDALIQRKHLFKSLVTVYGIDDSEHDGWLEKIQKLEMFFEFVEQNRKDLERYLALAKSSDADILG